MQKFRAVTAVLAQINGVLGDIQGNLKRVLETIDLAQTRYQPDLLIFPELTLTGYTPGDYLLRSEFIQASDRALSELIAHCPKQMTVVVGHPVLDQVSGMLRNAATVIQANTLLATYAKYHLPNESVFDEKRYFHALPQPKPCVFSCADLRLAVLICEDIWRPGPALAAYQAGAECLIVLNASPFYPGKAEERLATLRRMQAQEAPCPCFYVNWMAGQDELVFDGGSLLLDSQGQLVGEPIFFKEGLLAYQCDVASSLWSACCPYLIRPLNSSLQDKLYQALVLGLRDYLEKHQPDPDHSGVILGLSGGVDSALALCLAVDAVGASQVTALCLPYHYTSDASVEDAKTLARALGVECKVIPIHAMVNNALAQLRPDIPCREGSLTHQNIQARVRCLVLMAYSNQSGRFLLSTTNKSELAMGYGTLYGDMAGSFAVLKDLLKTQVYALANQRRDVIPERVLTRPASAELAPNQKDEDQLLPYPLLDRMITAYMTQGCDQQGLIAKGFDSACVTWFLNRFQQAEYKRFQAPPGVKVSISGFSACDWRYPLR